MAAPGMAKDSDAIRVDVGSLVRKLLQGGGVVGNLISPHLPWVRLMELPTSLRCPAVFHRECDVTQLSKSFWHSPPLIRPVPRNEHPLQIYIGSSPIREVDDRIFAVWVEIVRFIQDSVEVRLAVGGLNHKFLGRNTP